MEYNRDKIETLEKAWLKAKNLENPDTEDLKELSKQIKAAINILLIFPETESTRSWLCYQQAHIESILFHRKAKC